MMAGALVFDDAMVGMTEQSATRRPAMPCTRSRESTTESAAERPMRHEPTVCQAVCPVARA